VSVSLVSVRYVPTLASLRVVLELTIIFTVCQLHSHVYIFTVFYISNNSMQNATSCIKVVGCAFHLAPFFPRSYVYWLVQPLWMSLGGRFWVVRLLGVCILWDWSRGLGPWPAISLLCSHHVVVLLPPIKGHLHP